MISDYYRKASELYDEGWRADDQDIMGLLYELPYDDVEFICEILRQIELRENR